MNNKAFAILDRTRGWRWSFCEEISWKRNMKLLRMFERKNGHARVPVGYVTKCGVKLGSWLSVVRRRERTGRLTEVRRKDLLSLRGFTFNLREAMLQARRAALHAYMKRHKANPPVTFVTKDGYALGTYAAGLRSAHNLGRLSKVDERELMRLPGWTWRAPSSADDVLASLAAKAARGRISWFRPRNLTVRELQFLQQSRVRYRQGRIARSTQRALERLPGWDWDPAQACWLASYNKAMALAKASGGFPVLTRAGKLGNWLSNQLHNARLGKQSRLRLALLRKIPGWTLGKRDGREAEFEAAWLKNYTVAKKLFKAAGGVPPISTHRSFIGRWIKLQRCDARDGKQPSHRLALLRKLVGWHTKKLPRQRRLDD